MESLLQTEGNAHVIRRIESLRADAPRQWGKLTLAQMLVHCQRPFLVASGELKLKRSLLGRVFGGMAKKKFVASDAPFKRNLPTDPRFLAPEAHDVAKEQAALVTLVRRFGAEGLRTTDPHPFFGVLESAEWDRLLAKHLDHHLRQFGA